MDYHPPYILPSVTVNQGTIMVLKPGYTMEVYKGRPVREYLPVQAWEYYELSGFADSLTCPPPLLPNTLGGNAHAL
jgi:hypothetical protein